MNIVKNLLAVLFGLTVAALLFVAVDLYIGYRETRDIHYKNVEGLETSPPPESLVKNPDPNVPEDFIVPYNGAFSRFWGPDIEERSDFQLWNKFDEKLGSINGANLTVRHQMRKGKKYVYNVTYKTDQFGRRITPVSRLKERDKFLIFFGCSFVWGSCLNEDQTVPFYVGEMASQYVPYNYARGAAGTNYLLALLQNRDLSKEVHEKSGIGLYVFINDHVGRSIGDVINTASMDFMPYYEKIDGQLVRNGSFNSGRPLTTSIYKRLYRSNFFRTLHADWPPLTDSNFQFMCDLMAASRDEFLKQFPGSRFVVLFHPMFSSYAAQIEPCLLKSDVEFIDLSSRWIDQDAYRVPYDGHPNAIANRLLAEIIVEKLKLK